MYIAVGWAHGGSGRAYWVTFMPRDFCSPIMRALAEYMTTELRSIIISTRD